MGMSTTYDAGVVRRYMSPNASIQHVGSLLTEKIRGSIQTNVRLENKTEV